ncbi:hypothetical protein MLD38_024512 [Melastoma candidum]|uniref:Uncharacterized protein n=1 Tax=Melastoma candidum TaxID=119954 RepID=A0ACB9NTV5_9MYRT|nr:hypothetical protein MLD38_024512 [Melastoma candidum]
MAGLRNSHGKRSYHPTDEERGGNKRRSTGEDRDPFVISSDETVYRYLCPSKKIGSVIGRGGEIVKQLRLDTKAKIRIEDVVPGAEERVITIYSFSEESNAFDGSDDLVCPAQDALFKIHERVVADESHEDDSEAQLVTARLLVPSDQIGCIIGKGGQIVQNIRSETGANIRILKDNHLPAWAIESDELVQISGEAAVVKKALSEVASRLHDNPSRTQHILATAGSNMYSGSLVAPNAATPVLGLGPILDRYGGYRDEREWSHSLYPAPRNEMPSREFSIRLLCPIDNIGSVIGKGGAIINQIRHESGAVIKVDSSASEGTDCLIMISSKEAFDAAYSPTIEAAVRLQPRCSEKLERDSGLISFTLRLLVRSSQTGCLIGKGGCIISEMRRVTKATIRILSKDDLPKIAAADDEMVQISGDLDSAKDALIQVTTRLRANMFDKEGPSSSLMPIIPYLSMPPDGPEGLSHEPRDSRRHARGHSYSSAYGNSSSLTDDDHGVYRSQIGGSGSIYGVYGSYSSGRGSGSGPSRQDSVSRRRSYGY